MRISLPTLWFLSPLFTILGFLLALILLAHLLRQQRSPSSTIAWLLMILLLPYLGVPLYLMLGGRKMRQMARRKEPVYDPPRGTALRASGGATERILQSFGVPPTTSGNVVSLAETGEQAYEQLIELIDEARQTIHITTFILGRDPVGAAIVERLARRASEGVEVRLLLDDIGSWRINRRFLAPLISAGAQVAFFMPMLHIPFRGRANLRNHRKIMVVDDQRAIVGGRNLAESFMGPAPDPKRWRDLSMLVAGPAVVDLAELFRSDWTFATGEELTRPVRAESLHSREDGTAVQVVASGPDVAGDPFYDALINLLFTASRRVWVVTPYFVPDETLIHALDLASRRGVDVRLVLPARSNHLTADLARASYLRQVHESGGQVFLFEPVMVHAKAILIDDDLAVVGSANMDIRSLFLNYEVALFLYSRPQVEALAAWIEALTAGCKPGLPAQSWASELAENVVRLLSPLL